MLASTFAPWDLGIEGAYFNRAVGAPAIAGVYSIWEGSTGWTDAPAFAAVIATVGALGLLTGVSGLTGRDGPARCLAPFSLVAALGLLCVGIEYIATRGGAAGPAALVPSAVLVGAGAAEVLTERPPRLGSAAIIGGSGVALAGATFLHWYRNFLPGVYVDALDKRLAPPEGTAWHVFSATDIVVFAAGSSLIAYALVSALCARPARKTGWVVLALLIGAFGFAAWRTFSPPGANIFTAIGIGAIVALGALSAALVGMVTQLSQER